MFTNEAAAMAQRGDAGAGPSIFDALKFTRPKGHSV
jgi:hypothetical protein